MIRLVADRPSVPSFCFLDTFSPTAGEKIRPANEVPAGAGISHIESVVCQCWCGVDVEGLSDFLCRI
jgi:hypothetical protein